MASILRELAGRRQEQHGSSSVQEQVQKSAKSEIILRPRFHKGAKGLTEAGSDLETDDSSAGGAYEMRAHPSRTLSSALPPTPMPNIPGIGGISDPRQLMQQAISNKPPAPPSAYVLMPSRQVQSSTTTTGCGASGQRLLLEPLQHNSNQNGSMFIKASSEGGVATMADPLQSRRCVTTYKARRPFDPDPKLSSAKFFGPSHVSGWLPPGPGDDKLKHLPAKSGMSLRMRPARMSPSSCVPMPHLEPTNPPNPSFGANMAQVDALRTYNTDQIMNRLVYDCLLQPTYLALSIAATARASQATAQHGIQSVSAAELSDYSTLGGQQDEAASSTGGEDSSTTAAAADRGDTSISALTHNNRQLRHQQLSHQQLQFLEGGGTSCLISSGSERESTGSSNRFCAGGKASSLGPWRPTGAAAAAAAFSDQDCTSLSVQAAGGAASVGTAAGEKDVPSHYVENTSVSHQEQNAGTNEDLSSRQEDSVCSNRSTRFHYYPDLPPWYMPTSCSDNTLVFESRFESGNLRRVVQVYPNEYDLILRPDVNTRGHTQWFYFSIMNGRKGERYKFNLINLMKDDSLYDGDGGMLPLVHSQKELESSGTGWHRAGEKVAYYANTIRRGRHKRYCTLTFTLTLKHDEDLVHIAHCYPFTYSDLQRYLGALDTDSDHKARLRRECLCTSLAGNTCDLLTITSPSSSQEALKRRRGVIISSRVHPGESNASWMMKGVIDFLLGPSKEARQLCDQFIFKIIPMLNPDGVIVGNYRCSLAGQDLNRVFNEPSRKLHPTIAAFKSFSRNFMMERELVLSCDLHGHSRKKGIFIYGCEKSGKDMVPVYMGWPVPGSHGGLPGMAMRFQEKVFPLLLHHNVPHLFSYLSSSFRVQKSKAGTGRVVGFKELGLVNSYTLEASFCGASEGKLAGFHFNTACLEQMGAALVSTLLDYWDPVAYGMSDLVAELDFMHAETADGSRRKFITTTDGQLVEVDDDDEAATDSDDSDSDGGGGARTSKRAANRQQQGDLKDASIQGGHTSLNPLPLLSSVALAHAMANAPNQNEIACAAAAASAATTKEERKAAVKVLQKALLKAEQLKATEALRACLPMVAAASAAETTADIRSGDSGAREAAHRHQEGSEVPAAAASSGLLPAFSAVHLQRQKMSSARGVRGVESLRTQAKALEYAKQRGIYRGDDLSWANTGISMLAPESPSSKHRCMNCVNGMNDLGDHQAPPKATDSIGNSSPAAVRTQSRAPTPPPPHIVNQGSLTQYQSPLVIPLTAPVAATSSEQALSLHHTHVPGSPTKSIKAVINPPPYLLPTAMKPGDIDCQAGANTAGTQLSPRYNRLSYGAGADLERRSHSSDLQV
ncbi:hypothetical protein CEUSTIGMA_g5374.t1 [Chlamydomonas eustigma]|uniref:Peptidase M14 domain-containing protein n=1 Tax=Chlamydomonas eustigma TaxID=1157962 RepID=A0A250X4W7_9CHLO|nr:hypothetical protein CEUSTIGMA_g5374.t1 [Chlamydomonas eustigma]|eukprot:GAX77932.1 hypothetical protein CEUSTIGMA_g5374.t1 [Chlamydomonas eustigma]